jgi:hypothetical protein
MQDADFEDYIKNRYQREIRWYDRRARQNQLGYLMAHIYTIAAALAVPVLLSVENISLLVISALAASVAGIQALGTLLRFHENWLNYRTTAETMRKEIHFYHAGIDEYATADDSKALFVKRVEALVSRENTMWLIAAAQGEERRG